MNQIKKLWARLLQRFDSVDELLAGFDKHQRKLLEMSERLRARAAKQEEEAKRLVAEATAKSAEAERAVTVADRFRDLLSK
ncbi:hypothetical protein [Stenotrophomonas phage BUCTxx99]|nr:hypothetical protein [Stenotrophomonas phage BUCTxx99]